MPSLQSVCANRRARPGTTNYLVLITARIKIRAGQEIQYLKGLFLETVFFLSCRKKKTEGKQAFMKRINVVFSNITPPDLDNLTTLDGLRKKGHLGAFYKDFI